MARTATKRSSATRRKAGAATKKSAGGTARKAARAVKPERPSAPSRLARAAGKKALKTVARKALSAGAGALRAAAESTSAAGERALETGLSKRLPIQVSIDVAVPVNVAWDQWLEFGSLPEGIHRIEDVEREGGSLVGRTAGPRSVDWEAEIVDEREHESFAWRSVAGSDVAGLVTFHQLSERLTRIELDLDVLPRTPVEGITLALHLARRRAEADLRRFKAHVEFINPDTYESDSRRNGGEPDNT
jgi:uncharacterized membrane protein